MRCADLATGLPVFTPSSVISGVPGGLDGDDVRGPGLPSPLHAGHHVSCLRAGQVLCGPDGGDHDRPSPGQRGEQPGAQGGRGQH